MPKFRIKYTQEIEAENALEAAKQAQEGIIDQEAQTYIVQNAETHETFSVDLLDEGDEVVPTHPSAFVDKNCFS